ncbi:MAG: hypothetical protein K8S55_06930 [Phycisphaerae bacterium]|nr:hypothetical protein [Phycisphaerae bacterium]
MKRKLSKMEKAGLIAFVLVAGSYLYTNYVYDPAAKRLKTTRIQINKTRKKIAQKSSGVDKAEAVRLKRIVEKLSRKVAKRKEQFQAAYLKTRKAKDDVAAQQAITAISDLAEKYRIPVISQSLKKDKTAEPKAKMKITRRGRRGRRGRAVATETGKTASRPELDGFKWSRYELVLTGRYVGLIEFLNHLRQSGGLVVIHNLKVKTIDQYGKLEINMEIWL